MRFPQFISARMREVEPWKGLGELEFDTALDCMEKLVMNVSSFVLSVGDTYLENSQTSISGTASASLVRP